MSRTADSETLYPEHIYVAPGASIRIGPMAGQIACILKNDIIGGSLMVCNQVNSMGSSYAVGYSGYAAQNYLMGIGEILSFDSTGWFWLSAAGSTASCFVLRLLTAQTGN